MNAIRTNRDWRMHGARGFRGYNGRRRVYGVRIVKKKVTWTIYLSWSSKYVMIIIIIETIITKNCDNYE